MLKQTNKNFRVPNGLSRLWLLVIMTSAWTTNTVCFIQLVLSREHGHAMLINIFKSLFIVIWRHAVGPTVTIYVLQIMKFVAVSALCLWGLLCLCASVKAVGTLELMRDAAGNRKPHEASVFSLFFLYVIHPKHILTIKCHVKLLVLLWQLLTPTLCLLYPPPSTVLPYPPHCPQWAGLGSCPVGSGTVSVLSTASGAAAVWPMRWVCWRTTPSCAWWTCGSSSPDWTTTSRKSQVLENTSVS